MKALFFLVFLSPLSYSQNHHKFELTSNNIAHLNTQEFVSVLDSSTKDFKVIYTFATWCKPCIEILPTVIEIANKDNVDFYLTTFEKINSSDYKDLVRFLKKQDYGAKVNVYNIRNEDINNYKKNYLYFTKTIIPDKTNYGMGLIVVLNKQNKLLYASDWHQTKEQEIDSLKLSITD